MRQYNQKYNPPVEHQPSPESALLEFHPNEIEPPSFTASVIAVVGAALLLMVGGGFAIGYIIAREVSK